VAPSSLPPEISRTAGRLECPPAALAGIPNKEPTKRCEKSGD
jgi:hypothetical protein